MSWPRAWWLTLAYAVVLLTIHLIVTKGYAAAAVEPRLLGASVVIFAGAGLALVSWQVGVPLRFGIGAAFLTYEAVLAFAGWTRPFVGAYHGMGFLLGVGWGLAFERG